MTEHDRRHVIAAEGFVELGLVDDAFNELENVEREHRAHPDVLEVRWKIYEAAKKWTEAAEVTRGLTRIAPDRFAGWWMLSFTLHELGRTQEALDNLASVAARFKGEWLTHYNLACYFARLGRFDEARKSLDIAFVLNPQQRLAAINDPDLEHFWTEIQRGGTRNG